MDIDFKLKNKCGIYSIFNYVNGKRYIGSSKDIYNRWHEHWFNLKNNKAHNKHLQAAWNKYGEENFTFNVLEYCLEEDRYDREQFYITLLEPEYNFALQVNASIGREVPEEQRKQIAETLKKKYASGELTPFVRKDVLVKNYIYDITNWTLLHISESYVESARLLGLDSNTISRSKSKNRIYLAKYILLHEPIETVTQLKNYFYENFVLAKTSNENVKYIISFNQGDRNNLIYHRSYASCAREVGCSPECLRQHIDATIDNPYRLIKTNKCYCVSKEFIPLKETAVLIGKPTELLSGNIGETPEKDNSEINTEDNKSVSSYSIDVETM